MQKHILLACLFIANIHSMDKTLIKRDLQSSNNTDICLRMNIELNTALALINQESDEEATTTDLLPIMLQKEINNRIAINNHMNKLALLAQAFQTTDPERYDKIQEMTDATRLHNQKFIRKAQKKLGRLQLHPLSN